MNNASHTPALRERVLFNGLEALGTAIELGPEGRVHMRADRLLLRDVHLNAGLAEIIVARLTLRHARLMLASPPSTGSLEVQGLHADEVDLEGVEVTPGAAHASLPFAGGWRFDALGTLHGLLEAYIRDAAWVVDAHIRLPVAQGRVDFNTVVVAHVGPNSSMGVGRRGVYMESPGGLRTELFVFDAPQVPGASYEQRGGLGGARVTDRGRLDLPVVLEGLLSVPEPPPLAHLAGPDVGRMLDRTKLSGELRLGDGSLGTACHHLLLAGHAQGKNCMVLSAAVLGQRLVVRMPDLHAAGAVFQCLGQPGRTGPVSARVEAHLTAPAHSRGAAAGWKMAVHHMKVLQVRLGTLAGAAQASL